MVVKREKSTWYGSFRRVLKEGILPSFCVSAQWKMFWYSLGSIAEAIVALI